MMDGMMPMPKAQETLKLMPSAGASYHLGRFAQWGHDRSVKRQHYATWCKERLQETSRNHEKPQFLGVKTVKVCFTVCSSLGTCGRNWHVLRPHWPTTPGVRPHWIGWGTRNVQRPYIPYIVYVCRCSAYFRGWRIFFRGREFPKHANRWAFWKIHCCEYLWDRIHKQHGAVSPINLMLLE